MIRVRLISSLSRRCFSSDINQFHHEIVKVGQKSQITHFLAQHYVEADPVAKSLYLKPDEVEILFNDLFDRYIQNPVSLAFYSEKSLIGVSMNSILDFSEETEASEDEKKKYPFRVSTLLELIQKFENQLPLLKPDVQRWFNMNIASVRPDYLRQGLATQMSAMCIERAKETKCEGVVSFCTSDIAQNSLTKNFGFKPLTVFKYAEYLSADGQKILTNISDPESAMLMTKVF